LEIFLPEDKLAALLLMEIVIIIPNRVSIVTNASVIMYFELLITDKFRFSHVFICVLNYLHTIIMRIMLSDFKTVLTLAVDLKYFVLNVSALRWVILSE